MATSMTTRPEARLVAALERARALHAERAASTALAARLDCLADFQSRRLNATYADLAAQPRYAAAIEFFRTDLYGPGDYSRRDADLARIVPSLVRMMPSAVIAIVADAMQLSVLSQELDRALIDKLGTDLDVRAYCAAYRACANRGARERQIALIGEVGRGLDQYVHAPLLRKALLVMRVPARAAGMGVLQRFLERGVAGFARMRGAYEFLRTIDARETALMKAIFDGDDEPFPDPRT
jgi:hypothetical protein